MVTVHSIDDLHIVGASTKCIIIAPAGKPGFMRNPIFHKVMKRLACGDSVEIDFSESRTEKGVLFMWGYRAFEF